MTMGYDSTGGVYPGHYYGGGGGGCEDSRQHGWGGAEVLGENGDR